MTDREASEPPEAVLTGDTLFIGDVGRPDLLGAKVSADELAGQLYDSLHGKLLKLPDVGRGLSGARRRLALRAQHLERDELDDRRSSGGSTMRCGRCRARSSSRS